MRERRCVDGGDAGGKKTKAGVDEIRQLTLFGVFCFLPAPVSAFPAQFSMDAVAEAKAVWPGASTLVTVQEILDANKCVFLKKRKKAPAPCQREIGRQNAAFAPRLAQFDAQHSRLL